MFTGLVQKTGTLSGLSRNAGGWRLAVACEPWADDPYALGESIAVQGACLTVVGFSPSGFEVDVLDETLRRTAFQRLRKGSRLNLERALRLGDRMGGHIVSGHIDETGALLSIEDAGRDYELRIGCSKAFARQCVMKGSVALDGVSLTISALADDSFSVNIIPHTWEATSLRDLAAGDPVNLESDIIGKYVARQLGAGAAGGVTEDFLRKAGFLDE